MSKIIPIILCGGVGERLWPYSTQEKPKQFLNLVGEGSLLQQTITRFSEIRDIDFSDIIIVTLFQWEEEARQQIGSLNLSHRVHYLCEPCGRGTLAAVSYATLFAKQKFSNDCIVAILPSDHYIDDANKMGYTFKKAEPAVQAGCFVSVGIRPMHAETAYGYLQVNKTKIFSDILKVDIFHEKPDAEAAKSFINIGNSFWSTGIHLAKAGTFIYEIEKYSPDILVRISSCMNNDPYYADERLYHGVEKKSFEREIMQRSRNLYLVEADFCWYDVGRWQTIWEASAKDEEGNVIRGNVLCDNVQDSLIFAEGRNISCQGLQNTILVNTEQGILLAPLSSIGTSDTLIMPEVNILTDNQKGMFHDRQYIPLLPAQSISIEYIKEIDAYVYEIDNAENDDDQRYQNVRAVNA